MVSCAGASYTASVSANDAVLLTASGTEVSGTTYELYGTKCLDANDNGTITNNLSGLYLDASGAATAN